MYDVIVNQNEFPMVNAARAEDPAQLPVSVRRTGLTARHQSPLRTHVELPQLADVGLRTPAAQSQDVST